MSDTAVGSGNGKTNGSAGRLGGCAPYEMRAPCRFCGDPAKRGMLQTRGGQNVVRCAECGRACYNAPKVETGEAVRSLSSRPNVKPSQRSRILERDNHTCVGCHAADRQLHIGHLLSVEEGRELGADDALLWSDLNLAAMCEECNAGQGRRSLAPSLQFFLLRAWDRRGTQG